MNNNINMEIKESNFILRKVENLPPPYKKQVKYKQGFVILKVRKDRIKEIIPLKNGSILDEAKARAKQNKLTIEQAQEKLNRIDRSF